MPHSFHSFHWHTVASQQRTHPSCFSPAGKMAAPVVVKRSGPPLCSSFAEVCSFLERYGAALDLPEITFPLMEKYLRDTTTVPKPLVELHVKLLRKLGRSVSTDRWEKYLAKVCQELNSTWAWELDQKGYQEMSMECKSSILKYLCECQFDDNLKFKMAINEEDPEKMRLQPVGRDRYGLMYWLQLDQEQNIRLYTEEQDDLDGSTWKCIVRTRNDLAEALELLKAQIDLNQDQDKDQNQNQAGSRSTSPSEKDAGDEATGSTSWKPKTTDDFTMNEQEKGVQQVMKQEQTPTIKQENTEAEVKEDKADHKPPVFDNRVSTITTIVKSESRDTDTPKNAVSVVMAPSVMVTRQEIHKESEAGRSVVRSNQQAKIPLKKRELKLAESYHSNHNSSSSSSSSSSSIIVCNPSVIQSKDSHGREGKLPNSLVPPGSPAVSPQPQQLVVTASRQELTNGRASLLLPQKEGQNGVIGVIGQGAVVGHVGVIRSPSEHHRALCAEQQEQNGPRLDHWGPRAVEEEREVSRQSVLVKKGPSERETFAVAAAATALPPLSAKPPLSCTEPDQPPEAREKKVDFFSISSLSQSMQEAKRQTVEDQGKQAKEEQLNKETVIGHSSRQQKEDDVDGREDRRKQVLGYPLAGEGSNDEHENNKSTLQKVGAESGTYAPPLKVDQKYEKDRQDHLGDGVNGGLAVQVREKDSGHRSEERQGPLEEASSEIQKEGIRLKIKIPPHRRNRLRDKTVKEEGKEKEQELQEEGRPLRRSARICRSSALPTCRPSLKVADSQRKKPQRKQALPIRTREQEEEEDKEEEEDEEEYGVTAKKDRKAEASGQIRKRRGKRRHRHPRWSNIRSKRRKLSEGEVVDTGGKQGEGESEGGCDSEESCKSEEIPSEDACTHCGLPNHPELILLCDSCDNGYHTACLRPPLMLIPDGEWFCPPCQHKLLCEKLEEELQNLDSALKKRERAERRRERLVYVGISVENIIPEGDEEEEEKSAKKKDSKKTRNLGRRSTRTRKHISYRFDDFDDAIDEAIEEDIRDLCAGTGRGKAITTILSDDGKDSQRPIRSQAVASRNRRKRRLNDLESDSTAAESEDEFMLSNSSEDEDFCGSGADDDDEEEEDEDPGSDVGSWDSRARRRRALRRVPKHQHSNTLCRGSKRLRRQQKHSSEEEEESDEEMDSDQFSDMTDSDSDRKRRGLRRGQLQQVNYRETSESSDNSRFSARKEAKPHGRPRKENLSSDYSDVLASSRDSEEEDYEDEEDDNQRRRVNRRRRQEEDLHRKRINEKQRRYKDEEDDRERSRRLKRRLLEKEDDRLKRLKRTDRDEEDLDKMGRGKRREMLSKQRRKRLAQMLKKRRPSTDDEDEESEESKSSSEEDRPIRKRLNRIDSDDDDDDDDHDDDEDDNDNDDDDDDEEEGRRRMTTKKSSVVERRVDSDAQEKGRGRSLSPSNRHRTSRVLLKPGAGSPTVPTDSARSCRQGRHNGPIYPEVGEDDEDDDDEEEEEVVEVQADSLNSVQSSQQS